MANKYKYYDAVLDLEKKETSTYSGVPHQLYWLPWYI